LSRSFIGTRRSRVTRKLQHHGMYSAKTFRWSSLSVMIVIIPLPNPGTRGTGRLRSAVPPGILAVRRITSADLRPPGPRHDRREEGCGGSDRYRPGHADWTVPASCGGARPRDD